MICKTCKKEAPEGAAYCPWCGRLIGAVPKGKSKRGNGQGTAVKRGSTWTAKITVSSYVDANGKRHQIRKYKGGFKRKTDALDYCLKLKENAEAPRKVPQLADYWRQYADNGLLDLSRDKQYAYKAAWKRLKNIQYITVDKITSADMQQCVNKETKTYYPAKDMKNLLSNLYKLAGADGFVSKEVPSYIVLPELNETKREAFTEIEQAALWRAYESGCKKAAIPLVLIYTGMMPIEIMSLKPENVNLESATITGVGHKTKVRRNAEVYLPDAVIPIMEEAISSASGKQYVFPHDEKAFYETYYEALETANVRRLTPYSCRHTTATALAITEGIAPQTIKKIMRWSTTRMLDRYAHPSDQDVKAAVNSLSKK